MWVRGLKLPMILLTNLAPLVAPRVGAWIETKMYIQSLGNTKVAPRVGAWIETSFKVYPSVLNNVAPRVGAWIETSFPLLFRSVGMSHPVWVRGLKQLLSDHKIVEF